MMEEPQSKEAGWNLSESDIHLLSQLKREAIYYYNKGDLKKSFFKFKSMTFVIGGRFRREERNNLRQKEKEIYKQPDRPGSNLAQLLEEYIDKLNSLMRKYKLDIVDKERKEKLD